MYMFPLKNALPGTLLKNPNLDIDKKLLKIKTNRLLTMASACYQKQIYSNIRDCLIAETYESKYFFYQLLF